MSIDNLFTLSDMLDEYIAHLDARCAEYERAVMVNNDVVACISRQVKEEDHG